METPRGMRKQAATVFMPVRSVTVAEPPKISIAKNKSNSQWKFDSQGDGIDVLETMMLVARAKNKKTR